LEAENRNLKKSSMKQIVENKEFSYKNINLLTKQ